jgi:hypothetical protein
VVTLGEVLKFNGVTRLDLNPDGVLEEAVGKLESAIVIGFDKDGGEYFSSSLADGAEVVWLLERLKMKLLAMPDEEDAS